MEAPAGRRRQCHGVSDAGSRGRRPDALRVALLERREAVSGAAAAAVLKPPARVTVRVVVKGRDRFAAGTARHRRAAQI